MLNNKQIIYLCLFLIILICLLPNNNNKNKIRYLPESKLNEPLMDEIISYSMDGSKKIRSKILISLYNKMSNFNNDSDLINDAAQAIEYIHSASLILDDMMDGDTMRRGKDAVHIKYGYTMAQLTASLMLSIAMRKYYDCLTKMSKMYKNMNSDIPIILGDLFSRTIHELTIGQLKDITLNMQNKHKLSYKDIGKVIKNSYNNKNINIVNIIHKKTSILFEYCFIMPWIIANNHANHDKIIKGITDMSIVSKKLGLLYQIADDFEDVEQDIKNNGKNTIMNYVINKGKENAYNDFINLREEFVKDCVNMEIYTDVLDELLIMLSNKVKKN